MNKKCLLLSAAFAVAITFIACGDDSSTSASDSKSQSSEVKSFDDLPKCKSKNEGDTIFVKADDASYVCEAREWVLVEDENGEDDNDLSSSSENESSSSFDKSKYDEVKTKDDLDACTTKNKGDSVYVTKEDAVFTCENKKWVEVVFENEVDEPKYEEFKTIKDLPKCDSKTKGDSVYVTKEDAVYTCENKEWVEVKEESDDKDSDKKNKDDDDDDDDDVSSNSKKDKSSSSEDDDEKSSSSKDEEKSSSSEVTSSSSENTSSSSEVNSSSSENSSSSSVVNSSSSEETSSSSELSEYEKDMVSKKCDNNGDLFIGEFSNKEYVCANENRIMTSTDFLLMIEDGNCDIANETIFYKKASWTCHGEWDFNAKAATGTIKDANNHEYGTVWIGFQNWMAKNLGSADDEDNVNGIYCYDDDPDNCDDLGALYIYETAKNACPTGWHLPTNEEWEQLISFIVNDQNLSDSKIVGRYLKTTTGWGGNNGLDTYGFSAITTGYGYDANNYIAFVGKEEYSYYTSATTRYLFGLESYHQVLKIDYDNTSSLKSPVRCVED